MNNTKKETYLTIPDSVFENMITTDPTYRMILRELKMDDNWLWQAELQCQVVKQVIAKYVDKIAIQLLYQVEKNKLK